MPATEADFQQLDKQTGYTPAPTGTPSLSDQIKSWGQTAPPPPPAKIPQPGFFDRLGNDYVNATKGIGNAISEGADRISSGIQDLGTGIGKGNAGQALSGLGQIGLGVGGSALGTAGNVVGATFAPIGEAVGSIPKTGNSWIDAAVQGGTAGAALGGPVGAVGGAGVGLLYHGINAAQEELLKNPKFAQFAQANPDVLPMVNNALNVGLAILGEKKLGQKAGENDLLNKPLSEVPGQLASNLGKTALAGGRMALAPVKGATNLATTLAKYGTSQATGLSPETITRIIQNPEEFSPESIRSYTREGVASDALGAINQRLADLSETGKEYQGVRGQASPVSIPEGTVEGVLQKHGISVDEKGDLVFTKESIPTSPGDRTALQNWYDTYGKDTDHTSNSFLNGRKGLDNLAQWDSSKTDAANVLAMDLRKAWNKTGVPQIEGLSDLDKQYSSETQALKDVKKDYFKSDGTLKDNAISKISNLSNNGRESVLARLESVSPGIGEKIRTLKAVEDIQSASGQKVGTYARAITTGGAGYLAGGPVGAIVASVLAEPHIATQILRGWGSVLGVKESVLSKIVDTYQNSNPRGGFIDFNAPVGQNQEPTARPTTEPINPQTNTESNNITSNVPQASPKVNDVSTEGQNTVNLKVHPEDAKVMTDYIDAVRTGKEISLTADKNAQNLMEHYGINPDQPAGKIANQFDDILQKNSQALKQPSTSLKGEGAIPKTTFKGFSDMSTTILNDLKGKTEVSKQFIEDLSNQGSVRQAERDVMRNVLKDYSGSIPVKEFANKVKTELLPLKRAEEPTHLPRYENVTLPDDLRGPVANYKEHIYESPIKTSAGSTHFNSSEVPNYFAHTRIEDLPNSSVMKSHQLGTSIGKEELKASGGTTRRVIELQSDLFQKGRLEGENWGGYQYELDNAINQGDKAKVAKYEKILGDRKQELAKLEPYRNTWQERIIREEVKQAAKDGKTKLQFPTGETAMKIEGLGSRDEFVLQRNGKYGLNQTQLTPENAKMIEIGDNVKNARGGDEWVITDVLGDGKFKAVPSRGISSLEKRALQAGQTENLNFGPREETFDISGKVDTSNPIYKFYEKEVGRFLINRFNAKPITDPQGVKWMQVDIKPEMKKQPVQVFGAKQGRTYA